MIGSIRKYTSLFRIRYINTLQYRIAALSGLSTQFAWGTMLILAFSAFYRSNPDAFPMTFSQITSYVWIQQAFVVMFFVFMGDSEISSAIREGSIAYEMVRPMNLYNRWLCQIIASRLSRVTLRCIPIILVASFLPYPFGLSFPPSIWQFLLFIFSMALSLGVTSAILGLMYISLFYTLNQAGITGIGYSFIPFFPEPLLSVVQVLPFASMQDVPLRIFNGHIYGTDLIQSLALQVFWLAVLLLIGHLLMGRALKRVVVQGG